MSATRWMNVTELDQKFAGRRPLIKKLMETFLKTYNNFSLTMREKLVANDEKAMLIELHSLKGAAISLGAVQLHGVVERLEQQIKLKNLSFQDALNELEGLWPAVLKDTETVLEELK